MCEACDRPLSAADLIQHAHLLVAGRYDEAEAEVARLAPEHPELIAVMTMRLVGALSAGFIGGTVVVDRRGAGPADPLSVEGRFCRMSDHVFAEEPRQAYEALAGAEPRMLGEILMAAARYLMGVLTMDLPRGPGGPREVRIPTAGH